MARYMMDYNLARETAEQFLNMRNSLEDCSDRLSRISKDAQQGLEKDLAAMAVWSKTVLERAEDVSRASAQLNKAIDAYYNAERLSYERLTELDAPTIGGVSLRAMSPKLLKILGIYRLYRLWSNILRIRPNWGKWPALIHWRRIWILYPILIIDRRFIPIGKWRLGFILGRLGKRYGGKKGSEGELGQIGAGGGADSVEGSEDVVEGSGVIALAEEDFVSAEDEVEAETGRAEAAVEGLDESLDADAEVLDDTEVPSDFEETLNDDSSGDTDSSDSDIGSSDSFSRSSGGGGSSGRRASGESGSAAPDMGVPPEVVEFDESLPDAVYEAEPAAESPATDTPVAFQDKTYEIKAAVPDTSAVASAAPALKTGSGLSAPVIGVAAVSSMAASGLGLSNKLGGKGKTGGDPTEQKEEPVVTAKETVGNFSGNLKGEYVVLASALSIMFSGASLKAGMGSNKNPGKPDDRFRIGYGTSAILSGGAIQERS
ncbi:MAG: hypothetical protein FWH57_02385 [Oscillospiraceae bacterium]|nr:hypothetical protein [Oscillospiraceae bacterium]